MNPVKYIAFIALLFGLLTWGYARAGDISLTLLLSSDHHNGGDYNEDHHGVGFTYHGEKANHTIMSYENSEYNDSVLYMVSWKVGCASVFCMRTAVAGATGYDGGIEDEYAIAPFLIFNVGPAYAVTIPGVVTGYGLDLGGT